jgi:hypothetical protein
VILGLLEDRRGPSCHTPEIAGECGRLAERLGMRVGAELDEQPAAPVRQQPHVARVEAGATQVGREAIVEAFQSNRPVLHDRRNGVGGGEHILAEAQTGSRRRRADRFSVRISPVAVTWALLLHSGPGTR